MVRPDRRLRRGVRHWPSTGSGHLYVTDAEAELALRQTHLTTLNADINKGVATARRLPRVPGRSDQPRAPAREPAERPARAEGRRRHPAPHAGAGHAVEPDAAALHAGARSGSSRSTPKCRTALPRSARSTTSALFFDRVSKFPRIINIGDISITASPRQDPNNTDRRRPAPRRRSCCRKRAADGEGAARRPHADDHARPCCNVGVVTAALVVWRRVCRGQVPDPTPAINAAQEREGEDRGRAAEERRGAGCRKPAAAPTPPPRRRRRGAGARRPRRRRPARAPAIRTTPPDGAIRSSA